MGYTKGFLWLEIMYFSRYYSTVRCPVCRRVYIIIMFSTVETEIKTRMRILSVLYYSIYQLLIS